MSTAAARKRPTPVSIVWNYVSIALLLILSWLLAAGSHVLIESGVFEHGSNASMLLIFVEIVIIAVFGFLAYEMAKPTIVPSFVLAIFVGMLQHENLSVLVNNPATLTVLTTLGAIFILFGGGLDTPFTRFRALIGPILSVAFLGTLITAFLFSFGLLTISQMIGAAIPLGAAVLVGAALASTDPAAIIPSFKALTFKNPRTKYIAVSESALNDVVGAVLTGVFLAVLTKHTDTSSLTAIYSKLLTAETGLEIIREITIGCLVGVVGFGILRIWSQWKAKHGATGEADAALFLAVPLLCFTIAVVLEGNGFLAVFIASLLFNIEEHFQHVEHYFNHTIEGFMKPLIFMLLGAAVDIRDLATVAQLGIIMGFLFMFVIRPLVIFLTLSPFMGGKHKLSVQELLFLSFVRETGVIPAVLIIGLKVSGIPGTEVVTAIGLWVILLTLIVQPPLTPLVARVLGIASPVGPLAVSKEQGSLAVLCSRGTSFMHRLRTVAEWAQTHKLPTVTLLHCPEDKYSEHYIAERRKEAEELFAAINAGYKREGKKALNFEFLGKQGLLQDNIQSLTEQSDVSVIFVGKKMLDYRMEDIKRMHVPFVFLP